ncbi:MAG: Na/Pi cotransporter family protein [Eubacterium sp.]|nr:Na/Pi cotransporter family protein [Eubacterium sp.]MDE6155822.1 Na/Pi cotransporter family protein [Eubacterium sp.]
MTIFDLLTLIGGLAMFLFGMNVMGGSLEKISGGKLESILEKMTNNRIKGLFLGLVVTAIIQSSGAVTVMAVGFVNSGIMALKQVIGIIMGAHIGTTVTAWLLSLTGIEGSNIFIQLLKPSSFAPVLAFIGIIINMFAKGDKKKNVANILIGFAILMMGMNTMSSAVSGLKDVPEFTSLLLKFSNPLLGVIAGALLTAVLQSSSASVGILQALSATGAVSVSVAFPIILGMNIGACMPVLISAIGTNKNAKRTAGVNVVLAVSGVTLAMIVFYGANAIFGLPFFAEQVNATSIAVIHSVFNIFAAAVLFPFGGVFEKLMYKIIKDDPHTDKANEETTLIEDRFLLSPAYALDKIKEKCDEMALLAKTNISMSLDFLKIYSKNKDEKISKNEKLLDQYEDELETYLVQISALDLGINDSMRLSKYSHAIGNFERIGDYGVNILKTKRKMHKERIHFTEDANKELDIMAKAVKEIIENSTNAFINNDIELAQTIEPLEQVINNLKAQLRARHSRRMSDGECTIENGMLFFDIINSFERIADHCSNLAVCIIELSQGSYQTHSYLKEVKNSDNKHFMESFEEYLNKYAIR